MIQAETKNCLACGRAIKGRSDKRFCDDYCRNSYNNRLKSATNNLVRNINNALGKNRRILEGFLANGEENAKVNRDKLTRLGFNFKYITHSYTTKNGKTYLFCYDYGYLPLDNDWFLVVKSKAE